MRRVQEKVSGSSPLRLASCALSAVLAAAVVVLLLALVVLSHGYHQATELAPDAFAVLAVKEAPRPFSFDRPTAWRDHTPELRRSGVSWNVFVVGPKTGDGVRYAVLEVHIRPTAERSAELPSSGGPYATLEDFAIRLLPRDRESVVESRAVVDGREASDVTYNYVYSSLERYPPPTCPSRGRSLFFEDRRYYYHLSYSTAEVEYDRYAHLFDRMIATFKFLD